MEGVTDMTGFKEWLRSECIEAFDRTIVFEDGRLDATGPSEDRTIGCVWTVGAQEIEENVHQASFIFGIRLYRQAHMPTDPYTALSTTPLEEDIMTLCKRLEVNQSGDGTMWFYRVTSSEIDPSLYAIELQVTARGDNPFDP